MGQGLTKRVTSTSDDRSTDEHVEKEFEAVEFIDNVNNPDANPIGVATHHKVRVVMARCKRFPKTSTETYLNPEIENFLKELDYYVDNTQEESEKQFNETELGEAKIDEAVHYFAKNSKFRKIMSAEDNIAFHRNKLQKHSNRIKYFNDKGITEKDDALCCAYVLSFHTGVEHILVDQSQVSQGINLDGDSDKYHQLLNYYLSKAMTVIPCYWGQCVRTLNLTTEEQDFYQEDSIVLWKYFNSATRGDKPKSLFAGRNTYFHIWSASGRDITVFSNFPKEEEILLPPGSTFLVAKKVKSFWSNRVHIYLRQVELNPSKETILWVDDQVLANKSDNKYIIEQITANGLRKNIQLIPKLSTSQALNFLDSDFGQQLKSSDKFRIITDMNRPREKDGKWAGANLLKELRKKGFQQKVLIYCMNKPNAIAAVQAYCKGNAGVYAIFVDFDDDAIEFLL